MCLFSRIMLVGSPLGTMTYLGISSCLISSDRNGFHRVEWTLNLHRQWLVTPIMFVPLVRQWAYFVRSFIYCSLKSSQLGDPDGYPSHPSRVHRTFQRYES